MVMIIIITEQAFVCAYGSRTCTLTQSEDYTFSALFPPLRRVSTELACCCRLANVCEECKNKLVKMVKSPRQC